MISNQDKALDLTCELRAFGEFQLKEHLVLAHDNLKAANTAERPETVIPHAEGDAANSGQPGPGVTAQTLLERDPLHKLTLFVVRAESPTRSTYT